MLLQHSPDLEALRQKVRAFVTERSPARKNKAGVRAPDAEQVPAIRSWTAALFEAGFLGIDWPAEYGGRPDAHPLESVIVAEEITRARAWPPIGAGLLAAAALIQFGSPTQRRYFLPRIRTCSDVWCQLFSEPGAGSDLAALSTRAERVGDEFVVNGQKVWTTIGQHADVGYLLARTDPDAPKHQGITAFALNMRTPGITVRPLREITGTTDFNEVFLDDVRVPADRAIGPLNGGWRVAMSSLGHERSNVAGSGIELFRILDELIDIAGRCTPCGEARLADGAVRDRIGALAARVYVNDALVKLNLSRMVNGTESPIDAPLSKVFFSELNLDLAEYGLALQGSDGILTDADPKSTANGWWQDAFLYSRAYTIAGGANEVLRNVIAERGLGLPR